MKRIIHILLSGFFFCIAGFGFAAPYHDGLPATAPASFALPIVNAGKDAYICAGATLDMSTLGASIQSNGSGITTGTWLSGGSGSFGPNAAFPGATTYTPSTADIANGNVTLTLLATGGGASDQVLVTIHHSVTLICNDLVYVSLDVDCVTEVLPDDILEGTYDYPFYTVKLYDLQNHPLPSGNVVTGANVGQTLKAKVFDNCTGNYCWGNVIIQDKLAPNLTCSDITLSCAIATFSPEYLKNTLHLTNAYPTYSDCTPTTIEFNDTWHDLTCGQGYNGHNDLSAYNVRVWTVTDASGNSSTCVQNIYFNRRHISDVLFPADITLGCGKNVNTDPTVTGTPYIKDFGLNISLFPNNAYCEMQAAYVDELLPVCDGTRKIIRTWTVVDWCLPTNPTPPNANPQYVIQIITVMDNTGPVMTCPANLTVSVDPNSCCGTIDMPDVVITDNCSRVNNIHGQVNAFDFYLPTVSAGIFEFGGEVTTFPNNDLKQPDTLAAFGFTPCLPRGNHIVVYTAQDDCGNTSTCSFKMTVADLIPPVAVCLKKVEISLGPTGKANLNAASLDNGSWDNCGTVTVKAGRLNSGSYSNTIQFTCSDVGQTVMIDVRVWDIPENSTSVSSSQDEDHANNCMAQVTVQDKIPPVCIPPANLTVSCENFNPSLSMYGTATATDNCTVKSVTLTKTDYTLFDDVCNKGTISRTYLATDNHALTSQCTQRIVVDYKQDYYIHFPDDKIVTVCDGTGNYGEPTFFGKDCELLGVSYEDQVFTVVTDACYKIERTWTIINWCTFNANLPCIEVPNPNPNAISNHSSNLPGPIVSPAGTAAPWNPTIVKVNANDPTTTNYSVYFDANANCYKYKQIIKIIDSKPPVAQCPASPVEFCDLTINDPYLWNESYWWDNAIGQHDLCEGPSDLKLTATDLCSGPNISFRYLLFLDLDGDGTMETVVSSTNLPGWNTINYNNAANPNFAGGTPRLFDERPVPTNQKYGFAIETTVNGKNKTAAVRWNTQQTPTAFSVPELPYGTHKIKWIVSDGCGNDQECEYTFVVKDCKKPTVVCLNGLSVNIMPTGMIQMWASDFLQYGTDNCTPANQLKYGIRRSGTGTGFPVDGNGNPITGVTFTCADLGTQSVELWAIDKAGNADYCETYVIVQDNAGACPSVGPAKIAGALATEQTNGLDQGAVEITGSGNNIPAFTFTTMSDINGDYNFDAIPVNSNSTVTPVKDDNPLNGVSTYDLVLISKHILGIQPLSSPYFMIAADANKNGSITTFDIVELRKLILGIYTVLPNNTSWRFVDRAFAFPNPNNPFSSTFPENKSIVAFNSSMLSQDFVAIKVGDVNGSAIANAKMQAEDRATGTLLFDLTPRAVGAQPIPALPSTREVGDIHSAPALGSVGPGEVFTVNFKAAERVQGYQFTINLNGLEVVDLIPGEGMKADHFGLFADAITTSFDGNTTGEFTVKFRATKAGKLSEILGLSSRITKAEAYSNASEKMDVAFRFNQGGTSTIAGVGFELYQNEPNPFVNQTTIGFHLPEAGPATLTVYDETGRLVYTKNGDYAKGYNSITLDKAALHGTGVLYYKLENATDRATRKMVNIK
jgi:hypothetical protein